MIFWLTLALLLIHFLLTAKDHKLCDTEYARHYKLVFQIIPCASTAIQYLLSEANLLISTMSNARGAETAGVRLALWAATWF